MDLRNEEKYVLPVQKIDMIKQTENEDPWLVEYLWPKRGVGICGGPPKCRKSWFGLDTAISISSATECLNRFSVEDPETTLIYMAEDDIYEVKKRIDGICALRDVKVENLDLHMITTPQLLLDDADHKIRLSNTIEDVKPKFLLLDPLVRLHRLDENSSRDISQVLGFLRSLQRKFDISIMVTHHANKKTSGRPGERMRGSSDIYAFCDSAVYLFPKDSSYELTVEHRSRAAIEPFLVDLKTSDSHTCLQIIKSHNSITKSETIKKRITTILEATDHPMTRSKLRESLKIKNERLGNELVELEKKRKIVKTPEGWSLAPEKTD